MATIAIALLIALYMVLGPAPWLKQMMQLTAMHLDYKMFLILLAAAFLLIAWMYETHVASRLAKLLGQAKERVSGKAKKRKAYKVILENMRA